MTPTHGQVQVRLVPPPATPPDVVLRPEPGLARGLWEASPSTLYAAVGALLLAALLDLALRLRGRVRPSPPAPPGRP